MFKFFIGMCFGAASLFCYQHYNDGDVKQLRSKSEQTWKNTAPVRDKLGKAAGAAYEQLKK